MQPNAHIGNLLGHEVADLQSWLDSFEPSARGRRRRATLGHTQEYVVVKSLPLPDGYRPDEIDVLLLVDNFPSMPPIGLYALTEGNEQVVGQLRDRFNAFRNQAFHEAPPVERYTWICYAYADNAWRYNASDPRRGDNLKKFLASFYAEAVL